ncbi:MAG: MBL fold metallo-hydrolase [Bacteroidota bacterium]
MEFLFTGTGTSTGIPMVGCDCEVCRSTDPLDTRLRASGIVRSDETQFVIDTGPDFRRQMLQHNIQDIDAVVYTHQHKDHTAGLDDVRPFNYLHDKTMPLYVSEAVETHLRKEYYYIFERSDYPGLPRLTFQRIFPLQAFQIGDIDILPIPLMHGSLEVLGFKIGKFAYLTDTNGIPEISIPHLMHLDILVLDALRITPHYSHFNLEQALDMVEKLRPKRAYLTHISHLMGLHAEVSLGLPPRVSLAYDGLRLRWE